MRSLLPRAFHILFAAVALLLACGTESNAQSGLCDPNTPFYAVDLTGQPDGTWTSSPPKPRAGYCCGVTGNDKCIEFSITLDSNAAAINFQIASGAVPPGAMFYQIGCGPQTPVGTPICLNGPGPYTLTFCKPGNNQNTYSITSIPAPGTSADDTTANGCSAEIAITGVFEDNSIVWNDITSGTGQYNAFLSCPIGCDTVTVTPVAPYPAFVDYRVCGTPVAGECFPTPTYCDTIRVYFVAPLVATVTPSPAVFCANTPGVTLNATISGGVPPYNIKWTNGANGTGAVVSTTTSYTAMQAGTYSLVLSDETFPGCPPVIKNIPVTSQPVPVVNAGPDVTRCATAATIALNGSVTNAAGGIWTGGAGIFTPNNTSLNAVYTPTPAEIASGSVTLTLTSTGNGVCSSVSDQVTITIAQPMTVTIDPPVVCFGETGTITANVSGGLFPYSFVWSTGATTQSISDVTAGNYSVTVTDAMPNGCIATQSVAVTENPQMSISVPSSNVISCNATALVTISASGGAGSYTYLWNTGQTTPTIDVPSGMYIVTAFDTYGCSVSDTVMITAAGSSLTATLNTPSNLCFGTTTTLTVTASGGFGGYNYEWTNGSTSTSVTVGAGGHCVDVTDSGGCITSACVNVTQSPPLTVTIPTPSRVCNGGTTTIRAYPSGGKPGHTFLWSTGQTTPSITQPAGTYTVTVTDANSPGCTATTTATIIQNPLLTAAGSSTPVECHGGSTGTATVTPSGGQAPYSYLWPSTGSNSNTIYSVPAGSYQVTVTDATGCIRHTTVTVTQPPVLSASISSTTNVTCFGGNNGTAVVTPAGGNGGYMYNWSPAASTTTTATGLSAGSYTVNVSDSKGCLTAATATITEPPMLVAFPTSVTHISCFGGSNGSATVSATGGTGGYTFNWVTTSTNGATVTGLLPGTYYANATDASGCAATTSVTITQPDSIVTSVSSNISPSCFGFSNGSATAAASGGTPAYTFFWPSLNISGATATGLAAGTYSFTATDSKGCTKGGSVTISNPSAILFVSAGGFDATCFGACNGIAAVVPSGGTQPYTFEWSNGQTLPGIGNLCPGTYTVIVRDAKGCEKDTTLAVSEPPEIMVTASATPANCNKPQGTASVNASGGSPGYAYEWSTNPPKNTSTVNGLTPGLYTVTVTDNNSCTKSDTVRVVNIPGAAGALVSVTNALCNDSCNGSATVSAGGGTGPYAYAWSTIPSQNGVTATGLCAGTYTATITDGNGCTDTVHASVSEPQQVAVSISPVNATVCAGQPVTLTASATGGSGSFAYSWDNGAASGPNYTVNPVQTTTYTVMATDNNGCLSASQQVIVSVYPQLEVEVPPQLKSCPGQMTPIMAKASGGNPPYTFTWYPGGTTGNTIMVSPSGTTTYTVVVTDACGSMPDTATVKVGIYPQPLVNFTSNLTTGCAPLCIDFTDNTIISGDSIVMWTWNFGDNQPPSYGQNPRHCYLQSGQFDVTLTVITSHGCKSDPFVFPDLVDVWPTPSAGFSISPSEPVTNPAVISFIDQSFGATKWQWNFDDPNDSSYAFTQSASHLYSDSGTFCITQIVENELFCTDTAERCIDVKPGYSLYIPNAFTPNGNDRNDFFFAVGENILEFEMLLFDRWGNLIWQANKLEDKWDGRANGGDQIAQQDVYVWLVRFVPINGNEQKRRGHVTLIR